MKNSWLVNVDIPIDIATDFIGFNYPSKVDLDRENMGK
jgi:hypothetical protein